MTEASCISVSEEVINLRKRDIALLRFSRLRKYIFG